MLPTDTRQSFSLAPQNFEQAMQFANMLAESDLVPKDFKGKPGNCLIAIQWGYEVGMQPLQSLQNISVINGRPAMWGDALIALVRNSPLCEYIKEVDDGQTATCIGKRKGAPSEEVRTFSMEDANTAGLIGKQGPWTQYPKRMRQMRARAFLLRDLFPDVLRGMAVAEELQDEIDMGAAQVVDRQRTETAAPALTYYSEADFDKNLSAWTKLIQNGKKSAADIIKMAETKAPMTDEQKQKLEAITVLPQPTETAAQEGSDQ